MFISFEDLQKLPNTIRKQFAPKKTGIALMKEQAERARTQGIQDVAQDLDDLAVRFKQAVEVKRGPVDWQLYGQPGRILSMQLANQITAAPTDKDGHYNSTDDKHQRAADFGAFLVQIANPHKTPQNQSHAQAYAQQLIRDKLLGQDQWDAYLAIQDDDTRKKILLNAYRDAARRAAGAQQDKTLDDLALLYAQAEFEIGSASPLTFSPLVFPTPTRIQVKDEQGHITDEIVKTERSTWAYTMVLTSIEGEPAIEVDVGWRGHLSHVFNQKTTMLRALKTVDAYMKAGEWHNQYGMPAGVDLMYHYGKESGNRMSKKTVNTEAAFCNRRGIPFDIPEQYKDDQGKTVTLYGAANAKQFLQPEAKHLNDQIKQMYQAEKNAAGLSIKAPRSFHPKPTHTSRHHFDGWQTVFARDNATLSACMAKMATDLVVGKHMLAQKPSPQLKHDIQRTQDTLAFTHKERQAHTQDTIKTHHRKSGKDVATHFANQADDHALRQMALELIHQLDVKKIPNNQSQAFLKEAYDHIAQCMHPDAQEAQDAIRKTLHDYTQAARQGCADLITQANTNGLDQANQHALAYSLTSTVLSVDNTKDDLASQLQGQYAPAIQNPTLEAIEAARVGSSSEATKAHEQKLAKTLAHVGESHTSQARPTT